ncbi:hypothetical protein WN943_009764 [Citrus x changshan-huyou]
MSIALLHRYCRDSVLDVVVDRRHLHEDDFGHECYRRVMVYGDSFSSVEAVSTVLCARGLCSCVYSM